MFLFSTASRLSLWPMQPTVQWVLGVKWLGLETDHSPSSRVELYLYSTYMSSWHAQDNFTFFYVVTYSCIIQEFITQKKCICF